MAWIGNGIFSGARVDTWWFMDRLCCREAGDYHLQCLWRMVGDPALQADGVHIRQEGEGFHIRNADGSAQEVVPDPHVKSRWGSYPHSDGTISVLHQRIGCGLEPGTSFTFMNLLTPDTDIHMERVGPDAVKVTDADEVTLLGAGTLEMDDLELSGSMFACLARDNRVVVQGIERLAGQEVDCIEQVVDRPELAAAIRSVRETPAVRPPSDRPSVFRRPDATMAPGIPRLHPGYLRRRGRQSASGKRGRRRVAARGIRRDGLVSIRRRGGRRQPGTCIGHRRRREFGSPVGNRRLATYCTGRRFRRGAVAARVGEYVESRLEGVGPRRCGSGGQWRPERACRYRRMVCERVCERRQPQMGRVVSISRHNGVESGRRGRRRKGRGSGRYGILHAAHRA